MIDFRYKDKNNQKKGVRYYFSGPINLNEIGNDDETKAVLFDLPRASLIKSVQIITLTAGTGPVGIKCGNETLVNNDGSVNAEGIFTEVADLYFETGGLVTLNNTAGDAKSDKGVIKVGIEYVETERTYGEYTN